MIPSVTATAKARDVQIQCCFGCCPGRTWYGRKITPPSPSEAPTEPPLSLRQVLAVVPEHFPRKSIAAPRLQSSIDVLGASTGLHTFKQASHSPENKGDIRIIIHRHGEGIPSVSVYPK